MSEEPDSQSGDMMDEDLQREVDEALGGRSADDLFLGDEPLPVPSLAGGPVQTGQVRTATVVSIDRDCVLVELGGKDQGMVPLEQFDSVPKVGDRLELAVQRYDRDEDLWVLSRQGAIEHATWDDLTEGQIVEALVEGTNKGGLTVRFGGIEGFMPISQISLYRVEDAGEFVGQKLRCQVVEVDRHDERVIVSARAVLELEAQEKRRKLLEELKEGDVRPGVVRQVMPYGAFVDLGGADGLVHVSQMSYARVEDPAELVKPGQTVQVKVLKIDRDANRISLGMKQILPDPWENVEVKYPAGLAVAGRVTRLEGFGAFCQLEPGVEGLIPISEITWTGRIAHPSEVLAAGQTVNVLVLSCDGQRRRISLSVKQALANPWSGAEQRYRAQTEVEGKVTRIVEFGAFVELEPGIEGLVHVSEMSEQRIRRPEDAVQVGQTVRVRVLETSERARRIALSLKGVRQQAEPAPGQPAAAPAPKKRKKPLRGGLD